LCLTVIVGIEDAVVEVAVVVIEEEEVVATVAVNGCDGLVCDLLEFFLCGEG
jgi:hypothetical protein